MDTPTIAPQAKTAEIRLERHTVHEMLRKFKEILAQPDVISVSFEAGQPIRVVYIAGPLDPTLNERLAQEMTPESLMTLIKIEPTEGSNYLEQLGAALVEAAAVGLEFNACFVHKDNIDYKEKNTCLNLPLYKLDGNYIGRDQLIISAAPSSACSLAEVQVLWLINLK